MNFETNFQVLFNNNDIKTRNVSLQNIISKFHIYLWNNQFNKIGQLSDNSKIIIIDEYQHDFYNYYIICFDYHLIIIEQNVENQSKDLTLSNYIFKFTDSQIYFLKNKPISQKSSEAEDIIFRSEIQNFSKEFTIINDQFNLAWNSIVDCLSAFIIKKSYKDNSIKSNDRNSFKKFDILNEKIEKSRFNYIKLREISLGSSSSVDLIYWIEKEEIYALKIPNEGKIELIERERSNYSKIECPYIVQYYGYIEINDKKSLLLEFVEGETLSKYDLTKLNQNEKYNIIFELMLTIQYLHSKEFIYRDLHFDNVFINDNKDAILIDFDHLVKINEQNEMIDTEFDENMNYETDIMLLGYMMYYILYNEKPKINVLQGKYDFPKLSSKPQEKQFFESHFSSLFSNKLDINEFVHAFYTCFLSNNQTKGIKEKKLVKSLELNSLIINKDQVFFTLGLIYYEDKYVQRVIEKSIHYYTLAADNNSHKAQKNLGDIYNDGKYVPQDIEKAKYYYSLAAKNDINT